MLGVGNHSAAGPSRLVFASLRAHSQPVMLPHPTRFGALQSAAFLASIAVLATTARAQQDSVLSDLDWLWATVREQLYDADLAERFFPESRRTALAASASAMQTPDEFAAFANTLLDSLQISHMGLYTPSDLEYWLF